MINISFAVTVCNEAFELNRLLNQLKESVIEGDEVVIQVDNEKSTNEVLKVVSDFEGKYVKKTNSRKKERIINTVKTFCSLNGDFASFKNNIKKHCSKDWIFFIDADEEVNLEMISLIREVIEMNQDKVDVLLVPRVNTVSNLTEDHIQKWGWRVDERGWVNYPDYQFRLCKNVPDIRWQNKVHEVLVGYKSLAPLPADDNTFALGHHKTIEKQEKQNNFYNTI